MLRESKSGNESLKIETRPETVVGTKKHYHGFPIFHRYSYRPPSGPRRWKRGASQGSRGRQGSYLIALFSQYASERAQTAGQLVHFSSAESEKKKPMVAGAIHRGWTGLKAALTSGNDHAILAECERGEDRAIEAYKKALEQNVCLLM